MNKYYKKLKEMAGLAPINGRDKVSDITIPNNSAPGQISYSQSGEDLIIDYVLTNHFSVEKATYLDIGAYDPIKFSNTYLLYKKGGRGVLVEPDPDLVKNIAQKRPGDRVLNVGISDKDSTQDFYLVSPPTLNTFSKKDYEQYKLFYPGTTLRGTVKMEVLSATRLLDKYIKDGLDLLSIDVEGLDYKILSSINFKKNRPTVICIESVKYEKGNTWTKPKDIPRYLYKNGYFLYADTFINSIYVDKDKWIKNGQPNLNNFEGR